MKKMSLKPIIMSALAAIAFGTVSVGTTFALFTDKAETKITVKAGKVDVDTKISNAKFYSLDETTGVNIALSEAGSGTYEHPSTTTKVTFGEDKTITLDRIVPGDKITFTYTPSNASNVTIKGRFKILKSGVEKHLDKALIVKVGEATASKCNYASAWQTIEPTNVLGTGMQVEIEFPNTTEENDNQYQDGKITLAFVYEAVQGNATVSDLAFDEDDDSLMHINSPLALRELSAKIKAGEVGADKTILLDCDIDFGGEAFEPLADAAHPFKAIFDGQGHTIKNVKYQGERTEEISLIGAIEGGTVKNLNFENIKILDAYKGATIATRLSPVSTLENISVKNVKITAVRQSGGVTGGASYLSNAKNISGENIEIELEPALTSANVYDDGDKAGGLFACLQPDGNHKAENLSVKNVTIKGYRDIGAVYGAVGTDDLRTTNISGMKIEGDINLAIDQVTNSYGSKTVYVDTGSGIGRPLGKATITGVDVSNANYHVTQKTLDANNNPVNALVKDSSLKADSNGVLTFPSGYESIEMAGGDFAGNQEITKVVIPEGIKVLRGQKSFDSANNIEAIEIPQSIELLGNRVFYRVSPKIDTFDSTEYPNLKVIEESAFQQSYVKTVRIGGNIKDIPASMFLADTNLESLTIDEGVETIGFKAFGSDDTYDTKLKSLKIPSTVKSIGGGAFGYRCALEDLQILSSSLTIDTSRPLFLNKNNNAVTNKFMTVKVKESTVYEYLKGFGTFGEDGINTSPWLGCSAGNVKLVLDTTL